MSTQSIVDADIERAKRALERVGDTLGLLALLCVLTFALVAVNVLMLTITWVFIQTIDATHAERLIMFSIIAHIAVFINAYLIHTERI